MKKILYTVMLSFMLLVITGCNKTKTFTISLDSNASTGYAWVYTMSEEGIVKEIKNEYVTPDTDAVGIPGKQIFSFEGLKEGQVTLTFSYERSFEEESSIDTKTYHLVVDKNLKIVEK